MGVDGVSVPETEIEASLKTSLLANDDAGVAVGRGIAASVDGDVIVSGRS